MPFAVNVRLQLSFYLPQISKIEYVEHFTPRIHSSSSSFSLFKSVKPIIVPIVWFDDEATLHPDIHSELTTLVVSLNVVFYLKYIIVSISLLTLVISAVYIFRQVRLNILSCGCVSIVWIFLVA